MVRLRIALCLLAPALAGCYSERLPPPNFRHVCGSDGDCNSIERCVSGLCQKPCTQATADEACPNEEGYATCFNGVCVSPCELPPEVCEGQGNSETCERPEERGTCTAPHMCLDLAIDIGGEASFIPSSGDSDIGVCGQWCTESSCPEGEVCLARFCVATCDPDGPDTCNPAFGLTCQDGLCLPEAIEGMTDTDASTGASATMPTSDGTMTSDPTGAGSTMSGGT